VVAALPDLLGDVTARATTIELSRELLAAREAVRDEVVSRDRATILGLLATSTIIAAVVVLAGTVGSRRDFGRRRALGATRLQLAVLVVFATLWPALMGATLGTSLGTAAVWFALDRTIDPGFALAVAYLTTFALVAASVIPAAIAASRDPLRVLRVP
jgi:putative ABC transport system permease protein